MSVKHVSKKLRKSKHTKLAKSKSLRVSVLSKQASLRSKHSKVSTKKAPTKRSKLITKGTKKTLWHVRVPHEKKLSQFAKAAVEEESSDSDSIEQSPLLAPKFVDDKQPTEATFVAASD